MKTNIFFQNGMLNTYATSQYSANIISQDVAKPVGTIVNSTGGTFEDIIEYSNGNLYLKDALNGDVLTKLSQHNNKSLVIMHSAGNEDVMKAVEVLKLNNTNLNNKVDFISVGSPLSSKKLNTSLHEIGGNLIGQYNKITDPVTHPKTWGTSALAIASAAAYYGAGIGIISTTGTGLETFGNGLIGGGIGGTAIVSGIKLQHPFEKYYGDNYKGLANHIKSWSIQNP